MSVARQVTRLAVGLPPANPTLETFPISLHVLQNDRQNEDLPLGSRGGIAIRHNFPVEGEYEFAVPPRETQLQRDDHEAEEQVGHRGREEIGFDPGVREAERVGQVEVVVVDEDERRGGRDADQQDLTNDKPGRTRRESHPIRPPKGPTTAGEPASNQGEGTGVGYTFGRTLRWNQK